MKAFFIQILNDDMKTLGLTGKFETVNWPEHLSHSQNNTYECLDKNISMNSGSMVHDESFGPIFDSLVYFDTIDNRYIPAQGFNLDGIFLHYDSIL